MIRRYSIAILAVTSLIQLSCKPRSSSFSAVNHKEGFCKSKLNPGVAFISNTSWPSNVEFSGWSDPRTYQNAVAVLAKKNVDITKSSNPVIIAEAYPSGGSSSDQRWLAVYADQKLHIGLVSRSENKYLEDYYVIPNIVVKKITVEQHNRSMVVISGTDWNEAITFNLSNKLNYAANIIYNRNERLHDIREPKTFGVGIEAKKLYPSTRSIYDMGIVSTELSSDTSAALGEGSYHPYVEDQHLIFADSKNGGYVADNTSTPKDVADRFNRGFLKPSADYSKSHTDRTISALSTFPTKKPGLNSMLIAKSSCQIDKVTNDPKNCTRTISHISSSKDQSEKIVWSKSLGNNIAAGVIINHLTYSTDSNPKIAYSDASGVHILTKSTTGSYVKTKSFLTQKTIKSIKFLSSASADSNSDELVIAIQDGDRTVNKLVKMSRIFGPLELGNHPVATNSEKEWRFEYFDNLLNMDVHKDIQSFASQKSTRLEKFWKSRPRSDSAGVYAVKFDPNCRSAFSGGSDGSLYRWDILSAGYAARSNKEATLQPVLVGDKAHKGRIFKLDFSRDEKYLLSASNDNTIKIWSVDLLDIRGNKLSYQLPKSYAPESQDFKNRKIDFELSSGESVKKEETSTPPENKDNTNSTPTNTVSPLNNQQELSGAGFYEGTEDGNPGPGVLVAWKNENPKLLSYDDVPLVKKPVMMESTWQTVHPKDVTGKPTKTGSPETGPMLKNSHGSIVDFHNFYHDPLEKTADPTQGLIATISDSGIIAESEVGNRSQLNRRREFAYSSLTITSKNQFIFAGTVDGFVERTYTAFATGRGLGTVKNRQIAPWRHAGPVMGLNTRAAMADDSINPDYKNMDVLVSAGLDGTLRTYLGNLNDSDYATKVEARLPKAIYFSKYSLSSLDITSDHDYAVTGTVEGKVLLWFIGETINLDESLGQ